MKHDLRANWQAALHSQLHAGNLIERIIVVEEVESTQDEARRLSLPEGSMLLAMRQTRGRGRLGRPWHDTGDEGVAITAVLAADEPARLSIRCAVTASHAVEALIGRKVGIKWPNDLILDGRKIGGSLIELFEGRAFVGMGINVSQVQWPPHLAARAASLLERGHVVDRLELVRALLDCMNDIWKQNDQWLNDAFRARDVLCGRRATLEHDRRVVSGVIMAIDPMRSLIVEAESGPVTLPALSTRVLSTAGLW